MPKTVIISCFLLGFLISSCSKDEKIVKQEFPSLKEGVICNFYQISYVKNFTYERGYDSIFKVHENLYKYWVVSGRYLIDTIQLFKGSHKVYVSKQRMNPEYFDPTDTAGIAWAKLFEMDFRNSKIVTSDSIVGEYYNTYRYNSSLRQTYRDSGIFAIKVLP